MNWNVYIYIFIIISKLLFRVLKKNYKNFFLKWNKTKILEKGIYIIKIIKECARLIQIQIQMLVE